MPQLDVEAPKTAAAGRPACRAHRRLPSARDGQQALDAPRRRRPGRGSRLSDEKRLAGEIEEVARDARARAPRRAGAGPATLPTRRGRHREHRRPSALGLEQRHRRMRRPRAARSTSQVLRARGPRSRARIARPASIEPRRRELDGRRDRQVRVADELEPLERVGARAPAGRSTRIQPSLTCGRPADFDRPPSENVSARDSPAASTTASARGASG